MRPNGELPIHIRGWGRAHGPELVTNFDLEKRIETTDEWIVERTGIKQRYFGGSTSQMAIEASRMALDRAGLQPDDVDALIVASSTVERRFPGLHATVANELDFHGATIDMAAACSGFVYGLVNAVGLLQTGAKRVLVVASDAMSTVLDPDDRGTVILFSDGAGAVIVEQGGGGSLLSWDAGFEPGSAEILQAQHGEYLTMNGQAVFKVAVRAAQSSVEKTLASAELKSGDVDLFIPHQANTRITDALAKRLDMDSERIVNTLPEAGNSSSGTIPYAIDVAAEDGLLPDGSIVLMSGFGAGMTWATALFRWATS